MKLQFDLNPTFTDEDARMEHYLRGVMIVHDLTRFERAELLGAMGYTPEQIAAHFPLPTSFTHDDERACLMQPVADGKEREEGSTAPQRATAAPLHPEKKAMMEAMYRLGEKLATTEAHGAQLHRDQYLGLLLKAVKHNDQRRDGPALA